MDAIEFVVLNSIMRLIVIQTTEHQELTQASAGCDLSVTYLSLSYDKNATLFGVTFLIVRFFLLYLPAGLNGKAQRRDG